MTWDEAENNKERCEVLLESMEEYEGEYLTVMEPSEHAFMMQALSMMKNLLESGMFRDDVEKKKIETFDKYHQYIKKYKYDEDAIDDDITLNDLIDIHDEYERNE